MRYEIADRVNVYANYARGYSSGGFNGETNEVGAPKSIPRQGGRLGQAGRFTRCHRRISRLAGRAGSFGFQREGDQRVADLGAEIFVAAGRDGDILAAVLLQSVGDGRRLAAGGKPALP
ncbi:hypothetical protein BHE75_00147 [Sphingomonas haloaromaticamans]|uniref:Uncharacterized protein n=1 Tax=Edaphosphingomonas haloaromaticamans TaxID=653954 RepID=A0A1S1H7R0_9SPHN|nr:hypothetical protein BHE75_00147 [Sphingomonas haloaromaticamans]